MKTNLLQNIGSQIKQARLTAGLSVQKLSDKAGTSQPALSDIENGKRNISIFVLQKIAKALKKNLEINLIQK